MTVRDDRSELTLVREALAGKAQAVEAVVDVLARVPAILRAKNTKMGSPLSEHEIEDLAQDTITSVWRKLATFRGDAKLSTWVFGFAFREYFRGLRVRMRNAERASLEADPLERADPAGTKPAGDSAVDGELVHEALEHIDSEAAAILRAKHFEQWTFERISREWQLPLGTTKTRYYRALELLRVKLAPAIRRFT